MKKISVLILSLVFIVTLGFSQNLKIYYNGNLLTNNQEISAYGTPNDYIYVPFKVKNVGTSTISMKVKKIEHSLLNGSENAYCFAGNCFAPEIIISPNTAVIASNQFDTTFTADYNGNGKSGTSIISYVFYNINNVNDSVSVKVNYTTSVGINDISKADIQFSDAYPNPATNTTTIAYVLPKTTNIASIRISNILGSKIVEYTLDDLNGRKTIDISNLNEGVYFYSLIVNNKIYFTKKLVVK
jgi:hypothetical protein